MKKLLIPVLIVLLTLSLLVACSGGSDADYLYRDFTASEKALLQEYIGATVPFIPNNEYYLEGYTYKTDYDNGIRFYTYGNTEEDYSEYLELLDAVKAGNTSTDSEGREWTTYEHGDLVITAAFYEADGKTVVDVLVYSKTLSLTGHEHVIENHEAKAPTCTEIGWDAYETCSRCDYTTYVEKAALNHDTVSHDAKAPTCTEIGWDAYETCSRCDYSTYVEIPMLESDPEPDPEPTPDTVYNVITSLKNGDKIVIGAPAYGKALSVLKIATHYNQGIDYTVTDFNNITDNEIFVVTVYSDGTYKFTSLTGTVIALGADYNSLNSSGTNCYWTLEAVQGKTGVFYVKNTGRNNYLEWYADKNNWSTHKNENSDMFEISFYLVEEGGTVEGGGQGGSSATYTYTDFTSSEKALFTQYIGGVIPFVPNNEYYLTDWNGNTTNYEEGFNFYTFGNTESEFNAYCNLILASGYTFDSSYEDDYGDTCYVYYNGDIVIDVCYYESEGEYVIDLFVYSETMSEDSGNDNTGGSTTDVDLITNDGKGLPQDTEGTGTVKVDFTKAENVKDVTDQGYYLDGCPTVGAPAVLVIPVDFSDVTATSKGYDIEKIVTAFTGSSGTSYYSVEEYYKIASYGKLDIDVTVLDFWFRPQYDSSYYKSFTTDYYGSQVEAGDQLIINEVLAYLDEEKGWDLSQFDSDSNGTIDAIVIINTLEIDADSTFNWAYRYCNIYADDDGYYYEYDGVSANDYLWASYAFMHESFDEDGNVSYDDTDAIQTYTYIHEFGHVLGADDYYDTAYVGSPMDGADVMDSMQGDHNAYTKFNYGWLTESRLVVTDSSVTVTIEDFSKNGDTLIIANNWDESLGAYQEYYIIVYYTNNGLNSDGNGYFIRDGIVVYHVNASLYSEEYDGEIYYDVYNNNTDSSNEYGTPDNLIEYVKSAEGNFTYVEGDTLPTTALDSGDNLIYTFTVDSLGADSATITVSMAA